MAFTQIRLGWINFAVLATCGVGMLVAFRDNLHTPWPWALAGGLLTLGIGHLLAAYLMQHRLRTQTQVSRGARLGMIGVGVVGGVLLITGFFGTFLRPFFGW